MRHDDDDLMRELRTEMLLLDRAVREIRPRGKAKAETERDYRVALAKYIAAKRAEGVAVTTLGDMARGEPEIARLRLERDLADVIYTSNQEAINVQKLKLRLLDAQIAREWHANGA